MEGKIARDAKKKKEGKPMLLWKCEVWGSKNPKFIKEQEAGGLWRRLGIKSDLDEIPLLCLILFYRYIMNKIKDKLLLARDILMPEIHLKQPEFTYSMCWKFTKNKERIQNSKVTGDTRIHLSKRTIQNLLSTCHGLWSF